MQDISWILIEEGDATTHLLEEHESCPNESPTPASFLEQIYPADDLKLDSVADGTLL